MILGVEYAVGAHARIEELVERLDTDDRERHTAETAPECRRIEHARHAIGPGGAQQIGQQPGEQEEPVAYQPAGPAAAVGRVARRCPRR